MSDASGTRLSSVVKEDIGNILAKCRGEIEALRGSTILITGSTGFLARELTEALLEAGGRGRDIKLVLTSRDPDKVTRVFGDRLGPEVDIVPIGEIDTYGGRIDRIVHAASPCDPRVNIESPFRTMVDISHITHRTIALGLKNHLENFLFLSSGAVYGVQPPEMRRIAEEYQGAPDIRSKDSCYGEAKRVSEMMLTSSGLPFTILRGFSFIGPNQDLSTSFAAPEFISTGLREKKITIKGDGRPIRTFCYESDMAVMLLKTLVHAKNATLNAGNDRPEISIWELADIIARKIGEVEVRVEGTARPGLPPRYVPNIDRMRAYYDPTVNVESGIKRVIAHVREMAQK